MTDFDKKLLGLLEPLITDHKRKRIHEVIAQRTRRVAVVLEDSYHDANVSAILRSAECFGVQDIHMIENLNRSEFKVSIARGSDQWLTINRYNNEKNNSASCLDHLKNQGYSIVATVPDPNATSIAAIPLDKPVAVVFGNERLGVSDIVCSRADYLATIPMVGFTESFNVSVAASIILYDLTKRLKQQDIDWHLTDDEQQELKLSWLRFLVKGSDEIEQRLLIDVDTGQDAK